MPKHPALQPPEPYSAARYEDFTDYLHAVHTYEFSLPSMMVASHVMDERIGAVAQHFDLPTDISNAYLSAHRGIFQLGDRQYDAIQRSVQFDAEAITLNQYAVGSLALREHSAGAIQGVLRRDSGLLLDRQNSSRRGRTTLMAAYSVPMQMLYAPEMPVHDSMIAIPFEHMPFHKYFTAKDRQSQLSVITLAERIRHMRPQAVSLEATEQRLEALQPIVRFTVAARLLLLAADTCAFGEEGMPDMTVHWRDTLRLRSSTESAAIYQSAASIKIALENDPVRNHKRINELHNILEGWMLMREWFGTDKIIEKIRIYHAGRDNAHEPTTEHPPVAFVEQTAAPEPHILEAHSDLMAAVENHLQAWRPRSKIRKQLRPLTDALGQHLGDAQASSQAYDPATIAEGIARIGGLGGKPLAAGQIRIFLEAEQALAERRRMLSVHAGLRPIPATEATQATVSALTTHWQQCRVALWEALPAEARRIQAHIEKVRSQLAADESSATDN